MHPEKYKQYFRATKNISVFTMGTMQEHIKGQGAEINKKKTGTKKRHRSLEATRVSICILHGILRKMDYTNGPQSKSTIGRTIIEEDAKGNSTTDELSSDLSSSSKPKSMSSLILWNISKALEMNPTMDLKGSLIDASKRLGIETRDLNSVLAQFPEQQHLVCAMLAWQQLGHTDADSLYKFIETKKKEMSKKAAEVSCSGTCGSKSPNKDKISKAMTYTKIKEIYCCRDAAVSKNTQMQNGECGSFGSHSSGPVVKLPVEPKIVMRMDTSSPIVIHAGPKKRTPENQTLNKITAACCMDTACVKRLATLDTTTKELRSRAGKLAQREAERVELLERAEAAWKDLELGYQRRLVLAEEKEEDINRQIQKLIAERNEYKNTCVELTEQLKDRGDMVEMERAKLKEVEKLVCDRACIKLRLAEECARGETALAEHQCRAAQLDRDLQFKEEQTRRKLFSLESETESARALTFEAERAMRAELSALREQIGQVSNELLTEDEKNVRIKEELVKLRENKMEMVEDLEGCKTMCDVKMQSQVEVLQKRRDAINVLKEQIMECRCKEPVDETVEVKRTPSLAALCRCAPEDRLLESCSCSSLRGRLLSDLLADLFGGLQTELGGTGSQMPCQLLKCLEDKHNWDRASVLKTNLRNFFSKLLMGELDIAIATSIENYHAKWVGASCADAPKMTPDPNDQNEGWQQRALEKRAQKLATELAEQLFQERAEQLAQRAKEIVTSGPPPCECKPPTTTNTAAVFPCLTQTTSPPFGGGTTVVNRQATETPAYWKRTIQDVTQLRMQIEDLKKESIKKEDLKLMEEKIAKIVKQASCTENEAPKETSDVQGDTTKRETKTLRSPNIEENSQTKNQNKSGVSKKKPLDSNSILKKSPLNDRPTRQRKPGHGQAYAVNLCLCGPQKNSKNVPNSHAHNDGKSTWKQRISRDVMHQSSSVKQTKPISINLHNPSVEYDEVDNKTSTDNSCSSNCKCFHKVPSNTSIDKLLETLTKWKYDLADPQAKCIKNIKSSLSKYSKNVMRDSMRLNNSFDSKVDVSVSNSSYKEQFHRNHAHRKDGTAQAAHFATTESEYMGAVNLDKSNENLCKCIIQAESRKENTHEISLSDNYSSPIKCINSNPCQCKIYQNMQKDNNYSQTVETLKAETINQIQGVQTIEPLDLDKHTSTKTVHENKQKGMELSEKNSLTEKTKLFSNNCEYYIKFLGVTLADLGNQKKSKSMIKNPNHKGEVNAKEKSVETRRKRQKKLPHIDTPNLLMKPNIVPLDGSDHSDSFNNSKCPKCECNARFDELKSFMNNIFSKQLQSNMHKDEGHDAQSFNLHDSSMNSRFCCNAYNGDDSKELEVNAFHLLEDHLKGKLEEFKSFSCKSSCIPPEEEEKLFSAILKRVKQVISDCANEMKCNCPGNLPADGSWNRAYGLLQEYLKIKIKRVQCVCVFNDSKDAILPDILEKVCTLIENDFQRLKDICKCKNNNGTRRKSVRIEDLIIQPKELPEKDTNVTNHEIVEVQTLNVVDKLSKQNSNKSMIVKENISLQVPPNLGMDTKSCDVMEPDTKNAQTTETDEIVTESKSNGVMYNTCDCCYNTEVITNNDPFIDMFPTNEVLVNLYTDSVKPSSGLYNIAESLSRRTSKNRIYLIGSDSMKTLPDAETIERNIEKFDEEPESLEEPTKYRPYIGYTVDCSCNGVLGECVCMKSVVQANNDKIDNVYKEFLANFNNCHQDFSYIMCGRKNKDNDVMVKYNYTVAGDIEESDIQPNRAPGDNENMCVTEVSAQNEEEIVLKNSRVNFDTIHQTTNTFDENISLGTTCSTSVGPLDWFECPVPINSEERAGSVKLTNSIYFPVAVEDYNKTLHNSDTVTDTSISKTPQTCDCDRVPICHVKMLVENIEKNLIESKCTCDSLISKLCPVHSKQTLKMVTESKYKRDPHGVRNV